MRAGETMETALRDVVKDCKMGKILIKTNTHSNEPELIYTRLPPDVSRCNVFVTDAVVSTGAAAIMAIRVLLDHDVEESSITLMSLLMSRSGIHSLAYAFPNVVIATAAIDPNVTADGRIMPGMGNFGDRFYGTERAKSVSVASSEDDEVSSALTPC